MLEAGQVLKDNDPRYRGRKVEVVRVEGSRAVCKCGPRHFNVRLDYIFSDGTPRRTGYSTVPAEDSSCTVYSTAISAAPTAQIDGPLRSSP
jgi:hypothetical protein